MNLVWTDLESSLLRVLNALQHSFGRRRYSMSTRRYIINEQGERIGVLLGLEEYQQLTRLTPTRH
jgi:hypothetical protein